MNVFFSDMLEGNINIAIVACNNLYLYAGNLLGGDVTAVDETI